jgi:hypothetical protein
VSAPAAPGSPPAPADRGPDGQLAAPAGRQPDGQPAAPGPPAAPGQPARAPVARRRGLLATAGVLAAAVLAGIGYLVYGASSGGPAPAAVAVSYLQALASGDASAALALGGAPADRSRLTDDVLRAQQRLAPISGIEVLGTERGDYGAVVRVRYRIGSQTVQDALTLDARGSGWRLVNTAVNVEVTDPTALRQPLALGVPIPASGELWVFPGVVTFGSADGNFAIAPAQAVYSGPNVPALASLHLAASDDGRSAAGAALVAALGPCLAAVSLAPPGCPQRLAAPAGLVAGTERWQPPLGVEQLRFAVQGRSAGQLSVSGTLVFPVTYQVKVGTKLRPQTARVPATVTATVDLSTQPATVHLEPPR